MILRNVVYPLFYPLSIFARIFRKMRKRLPPLFFLYQILKKS